MVAGFGIDPVQTFGQEMHFSIPNHQRQQRAGATMRAVDRRRSAQQLEAGVFQVAVQHADTAVLSNAHEHPRIEQYLRPALLGANLSAVRNDDKPADVRLEPLISDVDTALKEMDQSRTGGYYGLCRRGRNEHGGASEDCKSLHHETNPDLSIGKMRETDQVLGSVRVSSQWS